MPSYNLYQYEEDGSVSPQWAFGQSRAPIQIFGGGYANGKTTAAVVLKALKLAVDYPGSNGLIARATYPKLNDTIRKVFLEWCPSSWIKRRPNVDDNTCYLHNGTVINFRYIAQRGKQSVDGQTTSNLLSATYDWIVVDQMEDPEIQHKDFLDLIGRLRGTTTYRPGGDDDPTMPATGPRWLVMTANPTGNWFYKEIVAPFIAWRDRGIKTDKLLLDASTGLPIMELFEGSTYTNKRNLAPDYIRNLETTYRGQQKDRYLLGKWAAFEGLVYGNFSPDNLLTREQAMKHLLAARGRFVKVALREAYDFGLASPSCYGLAFVDDHGRVVLLDGYYRPNFSYMDQPAAIMEIRDKYSQWLTYEDKIWADPDIFRKKVVIGKGSATAVASLYSDLGIHMRPAGNDIVNGIAKVSAYINGTAQTPHIVTGKPPGPLFYVVDDIEWFLDEIYAYYWKKTPAGNHTDEPMGEVDHAMDMVKYMMSKLPAPSEIVVPKNQLPPGWLFWHEQDGKGNERRLG